MSTFSAALFPEVYFPFILNQINQIWGFIIINCNWDSQHYNLWFESKKYLRIDKTTKVQDGVYNNYIFGKKLQNHEVLQMKMIY